MTPDTPAPTVADVFQIDRSLAIVVPEATPFPDVVQRFVERPDLRGIFVTDADGRLSGVITRQDLLAWVNANLPGPLRLGDFDWDHLWRMGRAGTARAACVDGSRDCAVRPTDPLDRALQSMLEHDLIDIPVVDDEGRILGDVRLTEILATALHLRAEA